MVFFAIMATDLTKGPVLRVLLRFSIPYLLSCFLQTFYGLADLCITGWYYGASTISAVSIGSQLMHMITVVTAGLAMGSTVCIARAMGAKDRRQASAAAGNTVTLFIIVSAVMTLLLIAGADKVIAALSTPEQAVAETKQYAVICFLGIPCITAYNVISSIFRSTGDSRHPMYFVMAAGVINILLDCLFIGPLHMGARGAALATVIAQSCSVVFALVMLRRLDTGITMRPQDLRPGQPLRGILKIGAPIALQDGLIQISFLVITAIANMRGVVAAASVGIVEKLISFLFLVPSAMLSSVSAIASQNAGAGRHGRSVQVLRYAVIICIAFGSLASAICIVQAERILSLFASHEPHITAMGSQYLRSYVFDCIFAGVHFCFSGYFCAYGKSNYSFIHNLTSIVLVRIPGAYLASLWYPDTLFPMGLAAPAGSLLSAGICLLLFFINTPSAHTADSMVYFNK